MSADSVLLADGRMASFGHYDDDLGRMSRFDDCSQVEAEKLERGIWDESVLGRIDTTELIEALASVLVRIRR